MFARAAHRSPQAQVLKRLGPSTGEGQGYLWLQCICLCEAGYASFVADVCPTDTVLCRIFAQCSAAAATLLMW
jgi:hypothetical protein